MSYLQAQLAGGFCLKESKKIRALKELFLKVNVCSKFEESSNTQLHSRNIDIIAEA